MVMMHRGYGGADEKSPRGRKKIWRLSAAPWDGQAYRSMAGKNSAFKMSRKNFPLNMVPLLPFFQGVEVMGEPVAKMGDDGEQKSTGDLAQWRVSVIVPQGRLLTERRVTVLAKSRPGVRDGQMVIFPDLHVGAYGTGAGAGLYFWATDVRAAAASEGSDV